MEHKTLFGLGFHWPFSTNSEQFFDIVDLLEIPNKITLRIVKKYWVLIKTT